MKRNRQVLLVSRPRGMIRENDFLLTESQVKHCGIGGVLIRTLYLSVDPYLRGRMNEGPMSFALNEPVRGGGLGVVEVSDAPRFKKGDLVTGMFEWADYVSLSADAVRKANTYGTPAITALSVHGLTGMAAYFGMTAIGKPLQGQTALISAAAGAVGSIAGQIARIKGCYVVGITGSSEKVRVLCEKFGFNDGINYKRGGLGDALKSACSRGVDLYFDNVGGEIGDEALRHLNQAARIVICGQLSLYNLEEQSVGPRPFPLLLAKAARAEGFTVKRYADHFDEAKMELSTWIKDGLLRTRETIVKGLENAPKALLGLFKGENIGKQLVQVGEAEGFESLLC